MPWLLVAFIVVPAVELAILIEIGAQMGVLATFGLICFTGILGAALARRQGSSALQELRGDLTEGRVPATSLLNAALVFAAGLLLLTPGLVTDLVGFTLLFPPARLAVRALLARRAESWLSQRTTVATSAAGFTAARRDPVPGAGVIIDLPPEQNR